jgi:serine/threonine protein phosphatase PrpC
MNFKLNIGCHLERGGREYQEDRIVALEISSSLDDNINNINNKSKCYIFCIFDGHGGDKCSKYLSKQFHTEIMKHSKFKTFPIIALQETWAKLDELFYNECQHDDDKVTTNDTTNNGKNNIGKRFPTDGSTATVCMIINNDIYVTNCGDSSAYLVNINDNFNIDNSSANADGTLVLNNNNNNNTSSSNSSSIPSSVVIVSNVMNGNYKKVNPENIIPSVTTPIIANTNKTTNTHTTTTTTTTNDYSIYKKYTYQQLTEDHGTHNSIEKLRCEKAGAIMIEQFYMTSLHFPFCCLRKKIIGKPRISPGGLLVTRSFGDFYAKKPFLGKYLIMKR